MIFSYLFFVYFNLKPVVFIYLSIYLFIYLLIFLFIYLFIYLTVAKWYLGNPSNPSSEILITALETVKMATTYDFSKLFVTALFI